MNNVVKKLLTSLEVAQRLNVSSSFFRKLVASQRAPAPIRLGRSRRWDEETISEWIAAGCPAINVWEGSKARNG